MASQRECRRAVTVSKLVSEENILQQCLGIWVLPRQTLTLSDIWGLTLCGHSNPVSKQTDSLVSTAVNRLVPVSSLEGNSKDLNRSPEQSQGACVSQLSVTVTNA